MNRTNFSLPNHVISAKAGGQNVQGRVTKPRFPLAGRNGRIRMSAHEDIPRGIMIAY
jgi:hypothetical protein